MQELPARNLKLVETKPVVPRSESVEAQKIAG
ncbi:hypothetical protein Arad_8001 [Rhizobium rhizogenes K84]|uniref:Uncharacterized protein n=1 Tax=Rhizobium rhizogenes (strain K84 / ATCC BAA-868) TaxID=311403 RepID=B9JHI5_RHIR8|nr:hypothetical protein Arad_8001 [Rhizobium rhizogenes K84]